MKMGQSKQQLEQVNSTDCLKGDKALKEMKGKENENN